MTYPRFIVTYGIMTEELDASPFHHSSLIFSKQTAANKTQVEDAIGFYSGRQMSPTHPVIKWIKTKLGFRVDLQNNHGVIQQEELRYIDRPGLKHVSFDVTQEQYSALQAEYKNAMAREKDAITEVSALLSQEKVENTGHTRWLREQLLFSERSAKARAEGREPPPQRLFPFHVDWTFSWKWANFGFSTESSYTCKSWALDMLLKVGIIDKPLHGQLSSSRAKRAFPRFVDVPLQEALLVSSGPLKKIVGPLKNERQRTFVNREWGDQGVEVCWGQQPQIHGTAVPIHEHALQVNQQRHLRNIIKTIHDVEVALYKRIDAYKIAQNTGRNYQLCCEQLDLVLKLREKLKATRYNQGEGSFTSRLLLAEKTLNTARMTLTPEKANYSFIHRAIENIALRHALLGFLVILLSATLLTGIASVAIATSASLFAGYKFYKACQSECQFTDMQEDYIQFHAARHKQPVTILRPARSLPECGSSDAIKSSRDTVSPWQMPSPGVSPVLA
jgi:hypothetical protein